MSTRTIDDGKVSQPATGTDGARRPYEAPVLRHLGSVRSLTLTNSKAGTISDGASGQHHNPSSRDAKTDIRYLDDEQRRRLAADVLSLRLATYRYRDGYDHVARGGDARALGFIV